jgi:hypothetical protein
MEKTLEDHLSRIKGHIATGHEVLRKLRNTELATYDIPDVTPDRSVLLADPPQDNDKYSSFSYLPLNQLIVTLPFS